ncbi:MAG: antibiotic biosynthesis monooxygenase [Desulfobacteraceae bacterium]|nr:MAG: antibiotic biosynthesis monooxygenase [Desulfobacteraceae bacterium]
MIVTSVTIFVKEAHVEEFKAACVENHQNSVKEPGNLRFDVLQCMDDPCRFLLYEVYETEAAALAHRETAHYLKWRQTVESWMAKPRDGVRHRVIAPMDKGKW